MSDLHPVVAELAAAIVRSPDRRRLALPVSAIDKCRAQVRALADDEIVAHLIGLAVKVRRVAGDGGLLVVAAIGAIVLESVGSAAGAKDRFARAGLDDAALAFVTSANRAPRAREGSTPMVVKPRRGLGAPRPSAA